MPDVVVTANGSAACFVILPIVGSDDESVLIWMRPDTNQFWLIAWSASAELTERERLCGLPSARRGTKGVRSRK